MPLKLLYPVNIYHPWLSDYGYHCLC